MSNETPLCSIKIADKNYVINMTGDQIVDALNRALSFDNSLVGTLKLESTKDNPCNLDLLRDINDYFIEYTANGPTAADDAVGVQVRVCEINGVLHQILYIKDDIYVRSFDENTNEFDEWDKFGYGTTVYDGNVPPGSGKVGTLWVDTSGALPALKRFDGKTWVNFSPVGPGEESKFIHNTVLLTNDVSIVPTGIDAYEKSKGHLLMCFINSTLMIESTDYTVLNDGIHIKKIDGTWRGTPLKPITFSFYLFKPGLTGNGAGGGFTPEMEAEFNDMKDRLNALWLYIAALEKELRGTNKDLTDRIEAIEAEIDRTNKDIEDTNEKIKEILDKMADDNDRITKLEETQEELLEKIITLEKIIEEGGGSWGALPANVVFYKEYIDSGNRDTDISDDMAEGDAKTELISAQSDTVPSKARATNSRLPNNIVYYRDSDGNVKTL